MIKVFNGAWRGIGESDWRLYLNIEFGFRELLHHFKGAKLHVFMALCLHSDQNGFSFPSYTTLQQETGYSREAISRTLEELCETKIDGHHVLMRWRETNGNGNGVGSNRYRIFPTKDEIASLNSDPDGWSENMTSHKSRLPDSQKIELAGSHKSRLEEEPVFKNNQGEEEVPPVEPEKETPAIPGKPYADAYLPKQEHSQKRAAMVALNAELDPKIRVPLVDLIAAYVGMTALIDADDVALMNVHRSAIKIHTMGATIEDLRRWWGAWKEDYRSNRPTLAQFEKFVSEQLEKAAPPPTTLQPQRRTVARGGSYAWS